MPRLNSGLTLGAVSHLTAGRGQMGTSLSFHLFFAVLGVGLPLMMLTAEGMHLRTGDLRPGKLPVGFAQRHGVVRHRADPPGDPPATLPSCFRHDI